MRASLRASAILISAALLVSSWAWAGYPLAAAVIALLSLLWVLLGRRWVFVGYVGLALVVLAAAAGEILQLPPMPLVLAVSSALAAWDLDHFSHRLAFAARQDDIRALERQHLAKLGLVLLIGTGLNVAALLLHGLRFNLEVSAGLALLAAWGLTYLVLRLRRARESS